MILRILDTDHVSLFQRRHPLVIQRIQEFSPNELAVTVITVEEQMRGWLAAIKQSTHSTQQINNYQKLMYSVEYFNTINVLLYNETASDCLTQMEFAWDSRNQLTQVMTKTVNGVVTQSLQTRCTG